MSGNRDGSGVEENTGKVILVVDDELSIRNAVCSFLRMDGWETLEAGDGRAALEVICKHQVDVILTDLAMPGMDGLTFIRSLRSSYPDLRIIAMTGMLGVKPGLRSELVLLNVDGVLEKPFAPDELSSVLKVVLISE